MEATIGNQPYLRPADGAQRTAADFIDRSTRDVRDDLLVAIEALRQKGLELIVLDHTRPDIGFPVARVVVPGLRHFWARNAPGRLYDVASRPGMARPAAGAKPTSTPSPFSYELFSACAALAAGSRRVIRSIGRDRSDDRFRGWRYRYLDAQKGGLARCSTRPHRWCRRSASSRAGQWRRFRSTLLLSRPADQPRRARGQRRLRPGAGWCDSCRAAHYSSCP